MITIGIIADVLLFLILCVLCAILNETKQRKYQSIYKQQSSKTKPTPISPPAGKKNRLN